MTQFPIMPSPEDLEKAAQEVRAAKATEAERLAAEAAANAAKADAATKLANAESALAAIGFGVGRVPPTPPNRPFFGSFGFGGDRNVVHILVGLAILLLFVFTFVLAMSKANWSSVHEAQKTATGAATAAASANAGVTALAAQVNTNTQAISKVSVDLASAQQSIVTIGGTANKALAEAEAAKALAAKKATCCTQRVASAGNNIARREASRPVPAVGATPLAQAPSPCTNCSQQASRPAFLVEREEDTSKTSRICGIAVLSSKGGPIIARLQLDEDPANPGWIRIAKVASFGGAALQVSVSPLRHSPTKNCDEDQAAVYEAWPQVVAKFGLPNNCTHQ